jgi:S1-C subfamily serine protease
MTTANTLYAALGVTPEATADNIEAAYRAREQAMQGQADALSLLRVAYDTLRQPEQRAAYDRKLARLNASQPNAAEPALTAYEKPPRQRLSRGVNWLILLLAASGTFGIFWFSKPQPKAKPAAATITRALEPAATAPAHAPAEAPEAQAAPMPAAAETNPAVPATNMASVAEAPERAPAPRAGRGTKQSGFDAQYVAWSVFTIRQRNLSGSGVLIGPDRILTNCHVLAGGATNGLVVINGLSKVVSKVEKYARLDGEDACLLLAPGAGNDSIAWGNSAALRPGDTVHTFGHPGGSSEIIWSEGSFRTRADRGGETFLISDNYCRPGSSGGPLLDNEGRLVGIVTAVQRFQAKGGEVPQFGACISVTEATARTLLGKPLFPIALAPAQYIPNY